MLSVFVVYSLSTLEILRRSLIKGLCVFSGKMEVARVLICVIPVRNMLSSLKADAAILHMDDHLKLNINKTDEACGRLPKEQEAPRPGCQPDGRSEAVGCKPLGVQINNYWNELTLRPFLGRDTANGSSRGFLYSCPLTNVSCPVRNQCFVTALGVTSRCTK